MRKLSAAAMLIAMLFCSVQALADAQSWVSTRNSSSTPLAGAATFTGEWEDVSNFASLVVAVLANADGTLYVDFSPDGSNTDSTLSFPFLASSNEVHRLTVTRRYARTRVLNGAAAQTSMRLQTMFGPQTLLNSALNSVIQQDADAIIVRERDFQFDIASGRAEGFSIVNKFGRNPDVDTGTVPEDIWGGDGAYTGFPTGAAETLQVFSSSASDTAAGAGARTVRISGLDANYNAINETVTLNGVTPVTTTASFLRAHTASVLTSGSSNTAFNVGTITVRHSTTTANVFLVLSIGTNQSTCSCYTVPAGYTAYMRSLSGQIRGSASAYMDGSIWVRTPTSAPRLRRPFNLTLSNFESAIYGGLVFTEKSDIVLRGTAASANNLDVTGAYDLILVKN